jgi:hypothetical protein
LEVEHNNRAICLHGFFIEGYAQGAVRPNPMYHGRGEVIVSVTSLLWSIVIYLGQMSEQIGQFLLSMSVVDHNVAVSAELISVRDAVIAVAGLHIYSLDERHPFDRVRLVVRADEATNADLRSNIYGSLLEPWSKVVQ